MITPFLQTKLYRPAPRPSLVTRAHLIQRLERAEQTGQRLILISAPAGSGKTTLLSSWLTAANHRGLTAWLTLDSDDNDPAHFWSYVLAALQTAEPRLGQALEPLLQTPQPPPLSTFLTLLLNDLTAQPEPVRLVLDDYHVITNPQLHEGLNFLLEHLPAQMQLVLATRADPPLPLGKLRVRNQLTEIRAADLRFTAEEATAFLNQCMGLKLQPEEVRALEARTEGWIAGLQLAALSLHERADPQAFIQAFAGSQRHLADYLLEEVLTQQTPATQTFLLRTSLLEQLTGPLCDALTERDDGAAQLEQLERANLFLIPLDEERRWYRYHHLFAELLRLRLQHTTSADDRAELHTRAALWHEQQRLVPEAMRHALAARNYPLVQRLMSRAAGRAMRRGEFATLRRWLETLPEPLRRTTPTFAFFYSMALLLSDQLEAVEEWLQAAEQNRSSEMPPEQAENLREGALAVRTLLAIYQGDVARTIEFGRAALAHIPENNAIQYGLVALGLGDAYRWSGDFPAAAQAYAQSAASSERGHNLSAQVEAQTHWASLCLAQGQLHRAQTLYTQAQHTAAHWPGRSTPPAIGITELGQSQLAYEWNQLDAAESYWQTGYAHCQQFTKLENLLTGQMLGLRLHLAHDRQPEAQALLQAATQLAQTSLIPPIRVQLAASQVYLWARRPNPEALRRWVATFEKETPIAPWPIYTQHLARKTLARAWLALDEPQRALEELLPLREKAEASAWWGRVIEIACLQARAHQAQGEAAPAHAALVRALTLAEPEGYVRTFVDEGEAMRGLIADGKKQSDAQALRIYMDKLLAAFPQTPPAARPAAANPQAALAEPLSARELAVLRLIAAERTNQEIAGELGVAVSTIKTHINHLYGKLGVTTREDAADRARAQGLL